jgi:hypothetical protein
MFECSLQARQDVAALPCLKPWRLRYSTWSSSSSEVIVIVAVSCRASRCGRGAPSAHQQCLASHSATLERRMYTRGG